MVWQSSENGHREIFGGDRFRVIFREKDEFVSSSPVMKFLTRDHHNYHCTAVAILQATVFII